VFVERSVLDLERIYVNGGRRGLLVCVVPAELTRVLAAVPVEVAL
jgi:prolyl-tRNA editing enzyme YbaK/EbsC (Cys-tRNA(Pro) deacylase)